MSFIENTSVRPLLVACIVILLVLSVLPLSSAQNDFDGQLNDVDVHLNTDDSLKISLYKDEELRFSVDYKELRLNTYEESYRVDLSDNEWGMDVDKEGGSFPHYTFTVSSDISAENEKLGNLEIGLSVINYKDTSEVTFSFTLTDIKDTIPGGNISIVQDLDVNGMIMKTPGQMGEEKLDYYQFEFNDGKTGYYSWNTQASVDGQKTTAESHMLYDGRLVLLTDYEADADEVSISPVKMGDTRTGAVVNVPEPYDHVPSFMIGVSLSAGLVIGVLYQKRKKFYEEKDSAKTVKLEESPYYKE